MTVVRVPPVLRSESGGAKEIVASGATVREVMENLSEQLPALGERVYDAGELRPFVNVYVDGEDVRTRAGLDTPVTTSSTVILLPAMAGGRLAPPVGRRSRAAEPPSARTCRP